MINRSKISNWYFQISYGSVTFIFYKYNFNTWRCYYPLHEIDHDNWACISICISQYSPTLKVQWHKRTAVELSRINPSVLLKTLSNLLFLMEKTLDPNDRQGAISNFPKTFIWSAVYQDKKRNDCVKGLGRKRRQITKTARYRLLAFSVCSWYL